MTPNEGDKPRNNIQTNNYFVKDASKVPFANDVYVGQIPVDVEFHVLKTFFSQFGEIERIFEGRKQPFGGMKWAFISYIHHEDAVKYISPSPYIWNSDM